MKQNTLIIILVLVAAGIGVYLYSEKQKQAAKPAAPGSNTVPERGGVSFTVSGQVPASSKSTRVELA